MKTHLPEKNRVSEVLTYRKRTGYLKNSYRKKTGYLKNSYQKKTGYLKTCLPEKNRVSEKFLPEKNRVYEKFLPLDIHISFGDQLGITKSYLFNTKYDKENI